MQTQQERHRLLLHATPQLRHTSCLSFCSSAAASSSACPPAREIQATHAHTNCGQCRSTLHQSGSLAKNSGRFSRVGNTLSSHSATTNTKLSNQIIRDICVTGEQLLCDRKVETTQVHFFPQYKCPETKNEDKTWFSNLQKVITCVMNRIRFSSTVPVGLFLWWCFVV